MAVGLETNFVAETIAVILALEWTGANNSQDWKLVSDSVSVLQSFVNNEVLWIVVAG